MKIEVMYFGRPSEYLQVTSERIKVDDDMLSLNEVLNKLRNRNSRWAYELDDSHVICTVNRKSALLTEAIEDGDEIDIFSMKSIFEL